jgi:hypothetical protein
LGHHPKQRQGNIMITRGRRWLMALAAMMTVASGAACASGPVQTLSSQGHPDLANASTIVRPGQSADGEAYVVNSAPGTVLVTGVSAVAIPGVPAGRLVHVALAATGAGVAAMRGWPPTGVPVRGFIGAELPHGVVGIIFGITGPATGRHYAVAGLRIEYRYRGGAYSAVAWAGMTACVTANPNSGSAKSFASCEQFSNQVNSILEKMAGLS